MAAKLARGLASRCGLAELEIGGVGTRRRRCACDVIRTTRPSQRGALAVSGKPEHRLVALRGGV